MVGQGNKVRLPAGGHRFLSSRNVDTTQRVRVFLSQRVKLSVREAMYSHTSNAEELCLHIPKRIHGTNMTHT